MKALFIGRFQPFHAGHLDALKQIKTDLSASSRQAKIIIGIGSSQYSGTEKNPYSFTERKKMIEKALGKNSRYKIIAVPDIHDPPNWVEHVKKIVGKFDVVYTGNDFTRQLFEKKGYKVKIVKKNIKINGTEIRRNMNYEKRGTD